jgi:hypothetical protein
MVLTFYDWLREYPYSSTFYVRKGASDDECHKFIAAAQAMSTCALGKYKIGYRQFVVRDLQDRLNALSPYAMGTLKWQVRYRINSYGSTHSHTIPGYKREHTLGRLHCGLKKAADHPYLDHQDWKHFLAVFRAICVSAEGNPIPHELEIKVSSQTGPRVVGRSGGNTCPRSVSLSPLASFSHVFHRKSMACEKMNLQNKGR